MAITLGVHSSAQNTNGTTVTTGSLTTQAAGSTLIAFAFGNHAVTVTDSKSNSWSVAGSQTFNGANGFSTCAFVQNATGGSGHTFTATQSGGNGPSIIVVEFIGAVLSGGFDAFNSSDDTSFAAGINTASITTVAANAAVAACVAGASNVNSAPTSTFGTALDAISAATFVTGGDSWFIQGTPGSGIHDTLTFSGQTFNDQATYTISFAPAAGGAGNTATIAWTK
jgi:hypothetical protein